MSLGVPRAVLALCLLSASMTGEAAAATGDLVQKEGVAGCLGTFRSCGPARALEGAWAVTVSPDGKNVYVASESDESSPRNDAVAVFDRDRNGTLRQKRGPAGCIADIGAARGCVDGRAVAGMSAATVSPDGRHAYVASRLSDAVAVFDRGGNGTLTQKRGLGGCVSDSGRGTPSDPATAGQCANGTGLVRPTSVVVSPDGRNVYLATDADEAGGVAVLARAADGTLSQVAGPAACITTGNNGACGHGKALDEASSVTVSPDGRSVYVAALLDPDEEGMDGAVAIFDRARNGGLTQKPGTAGCISRSGTAGILDDEPGACTAGRALTGATWVTVSPDGNSAYVAALTDGAVAIFDRAADGRLIQKAGEAGCIATRDEGAPRGTCAEGRVLGGASSVAVSPDGQSVYVPGSGLAILDRSPRGTLSQKRGRAGCTSDTGDNGACAAGRGLGESPFDVTVSPDGASVYVIGGRDEEPAKESIAVFDREHPRPGARPGSFRIVVRSVELALRDRITVECKVTGGPRLRTCSVELIALRSGVRAARRVSIGRARRVFRRPGRSRARVRIRLNRKGRRLVRAALDGVPVRVRARATRFGASPRRATARTRVIARRQKVAPRRVMYSRLAVEPNRYGRRFLASIARSSGHLAGVRCVGHAARDEPGAIGLARARARIACERLRRLGIATRTSSVGRGSREPRSRKEAHRNRRVEVILTHRRRRTRRAQPIAPATAARAARAIRAF